MPAPNIAVTTKIFARGVSRCVWVPTIVNINAPTRAEINAGTDLSREVADREGWTVAGEAIEVPNLGDEFTGTIPGGTSAESSSITMYVDIGGADARTLLPRNQPGNILWMYGGDVAGRVMDVFPVRVLSRGVEMSLGDEPVRLPIQFTVTSKPAEAVAIPA